jgi:hypothetical protein
MATYLKITANEPGAVDFLSINKSSHKVQGSQFLRLAFVLNITD